MVSNNAHSVYTPIYKLSKYDSNLNISWNFNNSNNGISSYTPVKQS